MLAQVSDGVAGKANKDLIAFNKELPYLGRLVGVVGIHGLSPCQRASAIAVAAALGPPGSAAILA
jgi:hypothetical protein